MPYVKVGVENSADIEIYYEDHGSGTPVVLGHGYPLSGEAWEKQIPMLLDAGFRVIIYDRRGWGRSSRPATGYDYDTFAADLAALLEQLDLHDAVLVGHSMGTGDVTRYLGSHGSSRVARIALISPIAPFLLATDADPVGLPSTVFDGFVETAQADRPAWMQGFLENFYDYDLYKGTRVSEQAFQASWNIGVAGSPIAAVACIRTWETDFRADVATFDVPVLIVHGDQDRVLPIQFTAERLKTQIEDLTYEVVPGGPHAIAWTHSTEVNDALRRFLTT